MLELDAVPFYNATRHLQHTLTFIKHYKPLVVEEGEDGSVTIHYIEDGPMKTLKEQSSNLRQSLHVLGAQITLMALDDYDALLAQQATWNEVERHVADVERTLRRELTQTKLLSLNREEQKLFESAEPLFGENFGRKFKTEGAVELEEAAKCLALGRPTACVFHLMRLMEIGIKAMSACLGIPDPVKPGDRNWGKILDKIRDEGLKVKWPTAATRAKGDGALFEVLYASLDAVKNPIRNSTMHVEHTYTESQAQHIMALVKGFMTQLSDRMDEHGEPKAP